MTGWFRQRGLTAAVAVWVLLPMSAGLCQDDGQGSIVGSWLTRADGFELRFEARPDGTFTRVMRTAEGEETTTGTYELERGILTVTGEDGEVVRFHCAFQGPDTITILADDGTGVRMERQAPAQPGGAQPGVGAQPGGPALPGAGQTPGALAPPFPLPAAPGGRIVFTKAVMTRLIAGGMDETAPFSKLFVMGADGSNPQPFLFGDATTTVREPHWTWDYSRLAFSSDYQSERSACVHDSFFCATDGSPAVRITGNELRGPAPLGYGAVMGLIQDNTKSDQWQLDRPSAAINITAQGANAIVHPGELENIDIVNKDTQDKLREESMRRFYIPHVAAGQNVWVKVWVNRNMGHLLFCNVQPGEVTDVGNAQVNECNYASSRPNITPDGRYCVGMGQILSTDPNAKTNAAGVETNMAQTGGAESITVTDMATGTLIASVDPLKMRAISAKDPAIGPDGRSVACSVGEPMLENLTILDLQGIIGGNPQPRVLVQGERIFPSELNGFQTANIACVGPAWSPDGSTIAFTRFVMGTENITGDVWLVGADGGGLRQLTRVAPNQLACQPCFSPDGSHVAFTVLTGKLGAFKIEHLLLMQFTADIYSMAVDGANLRQLTMDGVSTEPAWGP